MQAFVAGADAGSFVKSAETLDVSKAAISRYVAELESRLGVRLLHRTTRKLSLTPGGEVFQARCRELLGGVEWPRRRSPRAAARPAACCASTCLSPSACCTWRRCGRSSWRSTRRWVLDITLADRLVDLVEEGFDMAVRIARLPNSSLISRQLTSTRMVLCASPPYLQARRHPGHPSELAGHDVLVYSLLSAGDQWEFTGPEGAASVKVTPRLRTNSGDTCRVAALRHQGIVLSPASWSARTCWPARWWK